MATRTNVAVATDRSFEVNDMITANVPKGILATR
jgi:hypothetical protein